MPTSLPPLPTFALVLGAGAAAHWLAWRLRLPAILLLLTTGFAVGPLLGWLDPDHVFGDLFRPVVSLAVGLILFEGGMTLEFEELRGAGKVVRNLVTIGALATWALTTLAGVFVAGVEFDIALLVGALLVLTGPTVVLPLIRHARPRAPLGAIARWEGILIDPIGAVLALLVLEALTDGRNTVTSILTSVLATLAAGGGIGLILGFSVARAIERFQVPDMLHVPVTFSAVVVAFVAADTLQPEAGLLATTVMGIVMGNRRAIDIAHVYDWHEHLVAILLAMLFITIAARVPIAQLTGLGWHSVVFAGVLIALVRPIAVLLSTIGSDLRWRQRAFLMAMAPRGIVVAAVSSEFSLHLEHTGHAGATSIVAMVFPVIVLTVLVYGLTAAPLARWLGVAQSDPQGVLIVGAGVVGRELGRALHDQGFAVLLVDTNASNASTARMSGLRTWHGSVLSNRFAAEADLDGIGNVLAMTPSDEVNLLALNQMLPTFGRAHLYRTASLRPDDVGAGRLLFEPNATLESLTRRLQSGARLRATRLTKQFGPQQFLDHHGSEVLPLFVVDGQHLQFLTADTPSNLRAGTTVISICGDGNAAVERPPAAVDADTEQQPPAVHP